MTDFKKKHVLLFGLGLLGGGLATANWLIKNGAILTITDLKKEEELETILKKIEGKFNSSLGGHKKEDIDNTEIIVVNPAIVISKNKFIQYAIEKGKKITNEALIFLENWNKPVIGVTGTRGKTTTVSWTSHLLRTRFDSIAVGNNPKYPFLEAISYTPKANTIAVAEIPSHHLELFTSNTPSLNVAVITSILQDHLNRYDTMQEYARIKANIFINQTSEQHLVLGTNDEWTNFFQNLKPKSQIHLVSKNNLINESFIEKWGKHNVDNILTAIKIARIYDIPDEEIKKQIETLPQIKFRQETIYKKDGLTIINDTASTSPDAGIVAVERYGGSKTVLIAGGTDADLDFTKWVETVEKNIKPENIILLNGSATKKLKILNFKFQECNTLEKCLKEALKLNPEIILFSPACKSFEKFNNEYDRGEQFNQAVEKLLP